MLSSRWVFEFSIKHPPFALLVRYSEWILNHLVRNDFVVELDNRVIKTSPYETGNPAPRSTSLLNRILVGRRDDDDKQPRFQTAWFLGLTVGSDEVIALHPDGVQRHHGEWRVSPLDDPESNLRESKSALALMTEVDWRTSGCKTCQDVRYHKGWHSAECRERVLPPTVPDTMWPVASTKRLLDTGADGARDEHESKRHKNSDDTVPMAQEPSSGSGVKRSNVEAIRRTDAEAEKALKRAKVLEERRAAKRESATPMDELEESATNAEVTAESLMIAAEAVLTGTRETIEALTVSAFQQAHEMSHRPETTVESFFQVHKDMTMRWRMVTDKPQEFLGRSLCRTPQGYTFGVSCDYVTKLCKVFGSGELKGSNTLSFEKPDDNDTILEESGQRRHRQLLGKLLCLDRPDIKNAVCQLSTHVGTATTRDENNSKRLLRCLIGNPACHMVVGCNFDVLGIAGIPQGSVVLMTDADWAGDVKDRHSYSGIAVWVNGSVENK